MNEPNPLAAVGLPPTWQPAPCSWALAKLTADGPDGITTYHVLRLDTVFGVQGFAFDEDSARKLIDAMAGQLSGLNIARTLPPHTNGKG